MCVCMLSFAIQTTKRKKNPKNTHNGGDEKNNYFIIIYDNETTQNCHGCVCVFMRMNETKETFFFFDIFCQFIHSS